MAIRDVVTAGFGNGTFNSTIAFTTTRGYSIGEAVAATSGFMSDRHKINKQMKPGKRVETTRQNFRV